MRQASLSPAIDKALAIMKEHALEVSPGAMSTVVSGDDQVLFEALKQVFRETASQGDVVMTVTFSNACPV